MQENSFFDHKKINIDADESLCIVFAFPLKGPDDKVVTLSALDCVFLSYTQTKY